MGSPASDGREPGCVKIILIILLLSKYFPHLRYCYIIVSECDLS